MSYRRMKRLESKKSHSWWWDSHISPKNSKWLSENLEEMDRSVKRMLKLIEEEGDSFAKKAEMYYQRRPELISHVEEFYRMYRSLAERYDNLTGELRKNMASDLESQGSGVSDSNSEIATPLALDRKPSRRKSGARAAGFDVFLGSGGGSSDLSRKESDDSSSSSSSSDSESSSKHNGFGQSANGDVEGLRFRIIELEVEIRELKEKLRAAEEENSNVLSRLSGIGNMEELMSRVSWYEEELKVANERLKVSEEEISRLNHKLETNDSLEIVHNLHAQLESAEKEITLHLTELKVKDNQVFELNERITELEGIIKDEHGRIEALEQELSITKKEVKSSDEEIGRLKVELERKSSPEATNELRDHLVSTPTNSRNGDVILEPKRDGTTDGNADMMSADLKAMEEELRTRNDKLLLSGEEIAKLKLELEKTKISAATSVDLQLQLESAQEEIQKRESELEHEKKQVLELQDRIMRLESDIVDRDLEIGQLKSAIFDAHQDFSVEKSQLEKVVSGLSESIKSLEARLEEWELRGRSLEEEIKRVESEKSEMQRLHDSRERATQVEMERLKSGMEERSKRIEELNKSFDALKLKYDMLMSERDELSARVTTVTTELGTKDDHLHRLHLEHVELISGCEEARKLAGGLGSKVKELEEEVERQRVVISDGAEEKREAIRQLCFSLEHYRNGYHQLRQAFQVYKRPAVLAT